jgi:uncharacterized protein YprB with RNaseH-like and TPR domain
MTSPITLLDFTNTWLDEVLLQEIVYLEATQDNIVVISYPIDKMKSRYIFVQEKVGPDKKIMDKRDLQIKLVLMIKKYMDEGYEYMDVESIKLDDYNTNTLFIIKQTITKE